MNTPISKQCECYIQADCMTVRRCRRQAKAVIFRSGTVMALCLQHAGHKKDDES